MKIIIFCNIPSPYRIDFFNELGKRVDLTVVFEAKSAEGINFNWNVNQIEFFKAYFLKEGNITEKKFNFKILKFIKRNYYDYVIMTNYSYFTEMLALITMKMLRIPYFLEIDGGIIREESKLLKKFKTFLISNAIGYFSPSELSDDYLVFYGAKDELIHRYPFTSLMKMDILRKPTSERKKTMLKKELGIDEEKVVLAIGQFIPRKGFDNLLKASKDFDSNIGVYFIGGEKTEEFSKITKKYNIKNVYFKEFMDSETLSKYYKSADIFVLPTREDIWGLVINEAMSFGLPVISTDNCIAALELVTDYYNGFITEVDNVEELNLAINTIINDKDLIERMSLNSLKSIESFTIESMVEKHLEVFNKYKEYK